MEYYNIMSKMPSNIPSNSCSSCKNNSECSKPYTIRDKWIVSIILGFLFLILSSPFMYTISNGLFSTLGIKTSNLEGLPNGIGLILHGILFTLIVYLFIR